MIDTIDEYELIPPIKEKLGVEALADMIINFKSNGIDDYIEMVNELMSRGSYTYTPKKLDLDMKNKATLPTKLYIKETLISELKDLPSDLHYEFWGTKYLSCYYYD